MGIFKQVTQQLVDWLQGNATINTVEIGDANEFDISTVTEFPYVYLIPLKVAHKESLATITYQILFTDVYNSSYEDALNGNERFRHKIDVLDRMADVSIQFQRAFDLITTANFEPSPGDVIYDQKTNRVYGWMLEFSVTVPNIECSE